MHSQWSYKMVDAETRSKVDELLQSCTIEELERFSEIVRLRLQPQPQSAQLGHTTEERK